MNAISDPSLVEPEQDANTALTELDKGLRSGKIGEQCEAIVRFPRLFEKYPFPILINSSLLKLADVFRVGSNFLRVWVLRVCQQSEKHLDKILNVDEFVRRIFSVFHSNDPVARALTLRTLGAVAGIIPERQQVHHGIRSSLDSHDAVEVEAAIVAAAQFAAQSKKFAVSMCNKVSEMIQGLATPSHRKLQLIPILQHMHHDTSTASMVRLLCKQLLSGYPAEDFVLVTLSTLTQLAAATLVDIPQQVTLLVEYLQNDSRWRVKAAALEGLRRLAKEGPHFWPPHAVTEVVEVAMDSENPFLISSALDVLSVLSDSAQTCHSQVAPNSPLLKLARKCMVSSNTRIAAKAIRILATILSYCYEESLEVVDTVDTLACINSLFLLCSSEPVKLVEVKICLQAMVKLCTAFPGLARQFVHVISNRLFLSESCNLLICEALGAIGGKQVSVLKPILPDMVDKLMRLCRQSEPTDEQLQTVVILCTLLFQCQLGYEWNLEVRHAIVVATTSGNDWATFRIARSATRYGHHDISSDIFRRLKARVSSEHYYFWLSSLEELSKGEAALQGDDNVISRLSTALTHHSKALASLKAASTPSQSLQFQTEYVRVRSEFLQCLVQLVHACRSLCTAPTPAIAVPTITSKEEFHRFCHPVMQLKKCVRELGSCCEMYQKLYQSAFDADPESLANVQMYQQICLLLICCTEKVCTLQPVEDFIPDLGSEQHGLAIQNLASRCRAALALVNPVLNNAEEDNLPISHNLVNALVQEVIVLAETPFCLPRFYFQTLQSTSVKLNISPQPRVAGESISVQGGSQLAVKVEGVLVHGPRPGLFRKAASIVVSLQTQLQARQHAQPEVKSADVGSTVTQSVVPHRDFFTAQFLLPFPTGGQYSLTVEAAIADENGHIWKTGPRSTLGVKYHEESNKSQTASGSRGYASHVH